MPRSTKLSLGGWLLLLIGLLQFGSALRAGRIAVGGMLVHPYLLLAAPLGLLIIPLRLNRLPRALVKSCALFMAVLSMMIIPDPGVHYILVKTGAFFLTLLLVALMVKSPMDFQTGALGLAVGVGLMAFRGLNEVATGAVVAGAYGVNPLAEVASKNNYSLYSVPATFLALSVVTMKRPSWMVKVVLVVASLAMFAVAFSSANRSGWVAMLVIPLLLFTWRGKVKAVLLSTCLAVATWYVVDSLHLDHVVQGRFELTTQGYSSDEMRKKLYKAGMEIFLENPVIGALPGNLDYELGRRTQAGFTTVGSHSIVLACLAGMGILGTLPLVVFFKRYLIVNGVLQGGRSSPSPTPMMARGLVALWLVRGLFTDEVLFAPCFAIAFGLVLGLAMVEGSSPAPAQPASGPLRSWVRPPLPMGAIGAHSQPWTAHHSGMVAPDRYRST